MLDEITCKKFLISITFTPCKVTKEKKYTEMEDDIYRILQHFKLLSL